MEQSTKEKRIRQITSLYYSKPEIQKAIFEFSKHREVCPRYFEGFGKRPDSFQFKGDVLQLVKKGATSFHCSEEIWEDSLSIQTGMNEKQLNELRIGWDLLIDIDSKYIDYSKVCAKLIIKVLKFHGIKNIGIKFSGSKGFHLIVPWKAFPKEVNGIKTSDKFPEWPRAITKYIMDRIKQGLIKEISNLEKPNKYIRDFEAPKEVMPDLILVSPRHLFRMPYSLHEKTSLASVVLTESELDNFDMKHADPLKVQVKNFLPDSQEGEASELLMQSLDWDSEINPPKESSEKTKRDFKPINIKNLSDKNFPPTIKKILEGVSDGRKRSLFILINFFRSLNLDKEEIEKRIYEWNEKNEVPLKNGYIKSQLSWSFRKSPVMPPNFNSDHYKGIGFPPEKEELHFKNPVTYVVKKSVQPKNNTTFKNKK